MTVTDEKTIDAILDRGVLGQFLPTKDAFRDMLRSGRTLRFYMGADPTAKALHLGHAQNLLVLEDFRRLGHEVIFLIGDFTGMIGDPSEKSSARVTQTREEVEANFANWKQQTQNILAYDDPDNPVQLKYNSAWLGELRFADVLGLASNFTVQQMLERDMFAKRMQEGRPVYLHEFLYPLMQGYDSVVMDVDVELCGTDQIFNALAGRTLMQKMTGKEKMVIAANLIADEQTNVLMSKSNGTGVFLDLAPQDLFGAIMAQSDGMLRPLFVGCTRLPMDRVAELMALDNPRDAKIVLAHEIVRILHGDEAAAQAEAFFINTFSKKTLPDDVPTQTCAHGALLTDVLVESGAATSKSDARRKMQQGGVTINGEKYTDEHTIVTHAHDGGIMKVGKHFFVKIIVRAV